MQLQKLGLGTYLKSPSVRSDKTGADSLPVIYEDLYTLWSFLDKYQDVFFETLDVSDITATNTDGLSGTTLLVNPDTLSGALFNSSEERPNTIYESLIELYQTVDTAINSSDVSTELMLVKEAIGVNKFDNNLISADSSLDKELEEVRLSLQQVSADCFNRNSSIGDPQNQEIYTLSGEPKQTQDKSLRDLIDMLLDIHGGHNDLGHKDLGQKMTWAVNLPYSEEVSGATQKWSAPFGQSQADLAEAQKFYNPFPFKVKIKTLYVYINENTLADNTQVTLYKNASPTALEVFMAGGTTGSISSVPESITEVTLEPNSFIQFLTKAGTVASGSVRVANISIELQEIIE
jgi:hypothetical protein